jgi:hypothetical protein
VKVLAELSMETAAIIGEMRYVAATIAKMGEY